MAVLLEAYNLVIRNAALNEGYPGGTRRYVAEAPNTQVCTDGRLTRVGFMHIEDARREVMRLVAMGVMGVEGDGFDGAVIISAGDDCACPWLEVGEHEGKPAAWQCGTEPGALEVPQGWSDGCMRFHSAAEVDEHLEWLGTEDGVEVFVDRRTGQKLYTARTRGASTHLDDKEVEKLEALRQEAWDVLTPYLPLAEGPAKRGDSFFARRKIKKGLSMLDTVIAAAPDNESCYWLRGMALRALGDTEKSAVALAKAFELDPLHKDMAREYCAACLALGRGEEAVRVAQHNVDHHPDDAGLRANLALAFLVAGEVADALACAQAAVAQDPGDEISSRLLDFIQQVQAGEHPCPDRYPF